ncbi:hypothetical protein [uncultured Mucilaginibacter sp.]|uniref:hypothetical protein n=1 Tax=uncultured Mucilaginibacter sp. TaxID=797541 RepID=UPI0025F9243F|nr:hypothetical protein [uncultured Mucilaginibacter sp.]
MDKNQKLSFYNEKSLMFLNVNGTLRQIYVPFQVRCNQPVGGLKENTLVYVEAVSQHAEYRILYKVLNKWVPYFCFNLIIKI